MHYLLIKIQLLWAKHTKWLDRNPVKVPVSKRVIAYAIDWAVGGIISGFPASPSNNCILPSTTFKE